MRKTFPPAFDPFQPSSRKSCPTTIMPSFFHRKKCKLCLFIFYAPSVPGTDQLTVVAFHVVKIFWRSLRASWLQSLLALLSSAVTTFSYILSLSSFSTTDLLVRFMFSTTLAIMLSILSLVISVPSCYIIEFHFKIALQFAQY